MATEFSGQELPELIGTAAVPVWMPWPLPADWTVTGFAGETDARGDTCGSVVALAGPNPFGGHAQMLLISEETGLGLGARYAGLAGPDPGPDFPAGPPQAFVTFDNHDFPLWHLDAPHRAVYAGAAGGHWLWLVLWPDTAGLLMARPLPVRDLRDPSQKLPLPYGERSALLPRL
jgi:hypothetical protein